MTWSRRLPTSFTCRAAGVGHFPPTLSTRPIALIRLSLKNYHDQVFQRLGFDEEKKIGKNFYTMVRIQFTTASLKVCDRPFFRLNPKLHQTNAFGFAFVMVFAGAGPDMAAGTGQSVSSSLRLP